jgi:hypothetical protein
MKRSPRFLHLLGGVVFYECGLTIDADGSPRAYGPNNTGLDWTANAGYAGDWYGVVTDSTGKPTIQGVGAPYPGMYISTTALQDHSNSVTDTARYVDSEKVNYISVASDLMKLYGIKMGDLAAVYYRNTNTLYSAICADVGPRSKYGEGSIALATQLGIKNNPKNGGCNDNVVTIIFINSHSAWPLTDDIILELVKSLLQQAGGIQQFL